MRNLITDVAGVRVGHAGDPRLGSGVTVVMFDEPATASIDVRGGGPGTRETALLDPAQTVSGIDAIALSGGSAFGLDAASGVQAYLREQGRGFAVRSARVPIVPAAILFDLLSGGDKNWGRYPPYRELGYAAAESAGADFALGSVGAGLGAHTVNLQGRHRIGVCTRGRFHRRRARGGERRRQRHRRRQPAFWAAPFEQDREFGGAGLPASIPAEALEPRIKGRARGQYHAGRRGNRCGAEQGRGQTHRRHGADRPRARDLSGAYAARRRRAVRRRYREESAHRALARDSPSWRGRGQCHGAGDCARRL